MQTLLLAIRDGVPLKPSDVTKVPQSDLERLYPVYAGYYGGYSGSHQFTLYLENPEYDRYVLDSISPMMMAVIFGRHAALQTITTVYPSVNLNAYTEKGVPLAAMTRDPTILDIVRSYSQSNATTPNFEPPSYSSLLSLDEKDNSSSAISLPIAQPVSDPSPPPQCPPAANPFTEKPPSLFPKWWKVAEVGNWLRENGLGEYEEAFKANAVDGALLATLTEGDLASELGMQKALHRRKFFLALKQLTEPK